MKLKYERLAEQLRRNSSVPGEQQVVGSYCGVQTAEARWRN